MSSQDIGIARINQDILKSLLKKGFRMAHKILVKGVIQANKEA